MLGKLLKYEFKSTGRVMLPLYGVLFVLSLLNGFTIRRSFTQPYENVNNYVQIFVTFALFAIIVSIMVITFFNIITRFYKNLLGEEGYLMFTLPVKISSLVSSKIIFAMVWSISSMVVIFLSLGLMATIIGDVSFREILEGALEILRRANLEAPFNIYVTTLLMCLVGIASTLFSLITVYLAMAIGHLRNTGKIMTSIVAYIGISIIIQFGVILTAEGMVFLGDTGIFDFMKNFSYDTGIIITLSSAFVYISVFCFTFYKIICYILEKKLNLE